LTAIEHTQLAEKAQMGLLLVPERTAKPGPPDAQQQPYISNGLFTQNRIKNANFFFPKT